MAWLVLGMIVFIGVHLLPSFPALRQGLLDRTGARTYKTGFSLIAATGLVLLIFGKAQAEFIPIWTPPMWGRHAAWVLMPIAFILLAVAYLPSNIKRFTPHPMLWGVAIWAAAHLLANGDLASLILFGALGIFALIDIFSANLRGAKTSTMVYPRSRDVLALVVGIIAYAIFLMLHRPLFGVSPA